MVRSGQHSSWVMPSLSGVRRTRTNHASLELCEKSLQQRRAFTSPYGWSASAALIGKLDTTATSSAAQAHTQNKSNQKNLPAAGEWTCLKPRPYAQNATHKSGVLRFPCWSLASQQIMAGVLPRACRRLPRPVFPFLGPLLGGCSCRASAFLWARRIFPGSRYITGTLLECNRKAVQPIFYFQWVSRENKPAESQFQ
jgi:hypothetical protein